MVVLMEVSMSLNALVPPTKSKSSSSSSIFKSNWTRHEALLFSPQRRRRPQLQQQNNKRLVVIEAKGKRSMQARQYQPPRPPPLPKFEDDGNPRFVVFIRMANVNSFITQFHFIFLWLINSLL